MVLAGLDGLFSLVKKYEYEFEDSRAPLHEIINSTMVHLGNLIN
jgi:hypothetical protein